MTRVLSSTEVFTAFLPRIEVQLSDIYVSLKTLLGKNALGSSSAAAILANFPRSSDGYETIVDMTVKCGRYCPDSVIAILLNILPGRPNNYILQRIQQTTMLNESLLNLLVVTYFADCVAQLLSINPHTEYFEILIDTALQYAKPVVESHEEPLRKQIISQFAVIFSLLSSTHLSTLLDKFDLNISDSDLCLFMHLYKFVRLEITQAVPIARIGAFLSKWEQIVVDKENKKKQHVLNAWAECLCSLMAQINTHGREDLVAPVTKIYEFASRKVHEMYMTILTMILIQRDPKLSKNFRDFYKKNVLGKASKSSETLTCMYCFLAVLRGVDICPGNVFWVWGKVNGMEKKDIEITYLNEENQDQRGKDSYTSDFIKNFSKSNVWDYPELAGTILANLAVRDLEYFVTETLPKLSDKKSGLCVGVCLSKIIRILGNNPDCILQNTWNKTKDAGALLAKFYEQSKVSFKLMLANLKSEKQTKCACSFDIKLCDKFEGFALPVHTGPLSKAMLLRISEATNMTRAALGELSVNSLKESPESELEFTKYSVSTVQNSVRTVTGISVLPDIADCRAVETEKLMADLIGMIIAKDPEIMLISLQVLSYFYSKVPHLRIVILEETVSSIMECRELHFIFMFVQLLLKLFDLALKPDCSTERVQKFILNAQVTVMWLLAHDCPEIRDMSMNLIERIHRFACGYRYKCVLYDAIRRYGEQMATAVKYKVVRVARNDATKDLIENSSTVSIRNAFVSRYTDLASYCLAELVYVIGRIDDTKDLTMEMQKMAMEIVQKKKDVSGSFFLNMMIILSNTCTVVPDNEYDLFVRSFADQNTSFYNMPAVVSRERHDQWKDVCKIVPEITNSLEGIFQKHSDSFAFMHWCSSLYFLPILASRLDDKKAKESKKLIPLARVFRIVSENPDLPFVVVTSQETRIAFLSVLTSIEEYFNGKEHNSFERNTKASVPSELSELAIDFCLICRNFMNALVYNPQISTSGPFRSLRMTGNNLIGMTNFAKNSIPFLLNWTSLQNSRITEVVNSALAAILRTVGASEYDPDLIPVITQSELLGVPTIKYLLYNNFANWIRICMTNTYKGDAATSRVYFLSVCSALVHSDTTKSGSFGVSDQEKELQSTSELILQTVQSNTKAYMAVIEGTPSDDPLTEDDIAMNKAVMRYAGNLILYALVHLLDPSYEIRFLAYRLLIRLVPTIHVIIGGETLNLRGKLVQKLAHFARTFYSSFAAIPQSRITKLAQLIVVVMPQISDQVIDECFTCLQNSTNSPGRESLLWECVSVFMKENPLIQMNSEVFTQYTLVRRLLECYSHTNVITSYMCIWNQVASEERSVKMVLDIILSIDDPEYSDACVDVLVHLSRIYDATVIEELTSRLTFSYWYFENMQSLIKKGEKNECSFQVYQTILKALTQIAQISLDALSSRMYAIINFCFLFFDNAEAEIVQLLLAIFSSLPSPPQAIQKHLIPQIRVKWMRDCKHPFIGMTQFVTIVLEYFISQRAKGIIRNLGQEVLMWACGCGDLVIASRAAQIFALILRPFDAKVLSSVIRSLTIVADCPMSDTIAEYVHSMFEILNAIVANYAGEDAFQDSFDLLYRMILPFIYLPQHPDICSSALSIIAKYVISCEIPHADMEELCIATSRLFGQLESPRVVDGAFLSIFASTANNTDPNTIFTLYVPRLYCAMAAYHNVEPYASSMSDEEIRLVMQIGVHMSTCEVLPEVLSEYLESAFQHPEGTSPDEFIINCGTHLSSSVPADVQHASYILVRAAAFANSIYLSAIFRFVRSILDCRSFVNGPKLFSAMLPIAAKRDTPESFSIIEIYMNRAEISTEIPADDWAERFEVAIEEYKWETVGAKVYQLVKDDHYVIAEGTVAIKEPLAIAPIEAWANTTVERVKTELAKISVNPFTTDRRELKRIQQQKPIPNPEYEIPSKW